MIDISYRCDAGTLRPGKLSQADIATQAWQLREQLGHTDVPALSIERLMAIGSICVNGLAFRLEWSIDHPVHNADGLPVLGVCEYDDQGLRDTALISVNSHAADGRVEVMLSTLAHEFGHAVYDAPAWIGGSRTAGLPGLLDERPKQAFRTTTPDEAHLRAQTNLPVVKDWGEWRANELMGSFLVPEQLLIEPLREACSRRRVQLRAAADASALIPGAGPSRLAIGGLQDPAMRRRIPDLLRDLAGAFAVTPSFIEVRLKRYGVLPRTFERAA